MSAPAFITALPSSLSLDDLVTLAIEWSEDKDGEQPLVASVTQGMFASWARLRVLAQETPLAGLAEELTPRTVMIREIFPTTLSFLDMTRNLWPALAVVHYTKSVSTLVAIIKNAPGLVERLINDVPHPWNGVPLSLDEYRSLCTGLISVYASLWVVADQLLVIPSTRDQASALTEAVVTAVRIMHAEYTHNP